LIFPLNNTPDRQRLNSLLNNTGHPADQDHNFGPRVALKSIIHRQKAALEIIETKVKYQHGSIQPRYVVVLVSYRDLALENSTGSTGGSPSLSGNSIRLPTNFISTILVLLGNTQCIPIQNLRCTGQS